MSESDDRREIPLGLDLGVINQGRRSETDDRWEIQLDMDPVNVELEEVVEGPKGQI